MVDGGQAGESTLFQQWPMITDEDGELLVDFVGRFERLEEDWTTVAERIAARPHLPRTHATIHRHYGAYYDRETAELVAEACAKDIELFGYELEKLAPKERARDEIRYLGRAAYHRAWEGAKGTARARAPRIYESVRKLRRR